MSESSPRLRRSGHSTQVTNRTIDYQYDLLNRLTGAAYSTGESYQYVYDPVGNRLEQIISGDTTTYLYDAANRLQSINGVSVSYDANGNLLTTGVMTNSWDSANRLIETTRAGSTLQPIYDGLGNRVGQTVGVSTTWYALDVAIGLPEVLYTSEGHKYLHLPGLIMTESDTGEVRYLLSDGLGSVRHAVDGAGTVVAYREYDPYGSPVVGDESGYSFTGEWWESEVGLLHLRARWYSSEHGVFLSRDVVESEPPYQYVRGNPVNWVDPSGNYPCITCIAEELVEVIATLIEYDYKHRRMAGDAVLKMAGPVIDQEASVYNVDPIIAKSVIWHESGAIERRIFAPVPGTRPGFCANFVELIQQSYWHFLLQKDASIGPAQLRVGNVQRLDEQLLVPTRSRDGHLLAMLDEKQSVEYVLATLYRTSVALVNINPTLEQPENQEYLQRLTLILYNWGRDENLLEQIRDGNFESVINSHIYDNETLDDYLEWNECSMDLCQFSE